MLVSGLRLVMRMVIKLFAEGVAEKSFHGGLREVFRVAVFRRAGGQVKVFRGGPLELHLPEPHENRVAVIHGLNLHGKFFQVRGAPDGGGVFAAVGFRDDDPVLDTGMAVKGFARERSFVQLRRLLQRGHVFLVQRRDDARLKFRIEQVGLLLVRADEGDDVIHADAAGGGGRERGQILGLEFRHVEVAAHLAVEQAELHRRVQGFRAVRVRHADFQLRGEASDIAEQADQRGVQSRRGARRELGVQRGRACQQDEAAEEDGDADESKPDGNHGGNIDWQGRLTQRNVRRNTGEGTTRPVFVRSPAFRRFHINGR